jgi:hypothetical protein
MSITRNTFCGKVQKFLMVQQVVLKILKILIRNSEEGRKIERSRSKWEIQSKECPYSMLDTKAWTLFIFPWAKDQ